MPRSSGCMPLGSVEASVVGISHLFRTSADSNGALLKKLARVLGKCNVNAYGLSEVILKRNVNIAADANAVGVAISESEEFIEGGRYCYYVRLFTFQVCIYFVSIQRVGQIIG